MMEPALQLALHGTAYRTGAVTSARRVLMNYELGGCAGDWQGPQRAVKGRQTGFFDRIRHSVTRSILFNASEYAVVEQL